MKIGACLLSVPGILAVMLLSSVGQPQEKPKEDEGMEVQARGPIHEAFAQPSDLKQEAAPPIAKKPPEPIDELPPDEKPDAAAAIWISGYWAWDEDREGFLWVSGIWRVPPPDRQWMPGYWQEAEGGWRWVSGYWSAGASVDLLPEPPAPIDEAIPPPANKDQVYAPGNWVYRETRYFWQPGHWIVLSPNWVWIPARFCWTPGGYVFIAGHWDLDLHHRGFCYSPVYIDPRLYARRDWHYRPRYVIQPDFLIGSLFINLRCHHYYFGDYYEAGYARRGFEAWVDFRVQRTAYDPLFTYYRWEHRDQPRWDADVRAVYVDRRDNAKARPPRTLAAQQTTNVSVVVVAAQVKNSPFKVTQVTKAQVADIQKVAAEWHNVSKQRGKSEAAAVKSNKQPGAAPIKLELPKAPVKIATPHKTPLPVGPKIQDVKDKASKDKGPESRFQAGRNEKAGNY